MQKFTRALVREVEVAGERLAFEFDEAGVSVRPVGSRKPPLRATWAAVVCALAGRAGEPVADEVQKAIEALRGGASADEGLAGDLARLDAWLKKNRKRYHKGLRPGASEPDLASLAKQLGKAVPEDVAAWLRWHDGQHEDLIGCFHESFRLMSVAEIVEAMKDEGWDGSLVPLMDDHQDDYVAVDVSAAGSPVVEVWRGRKDRPRAAKSLREWAAKFAADVEAGKYHEESERGEFMRETE